MDTWHIVILIFIMVALAFVIYEASHDDDDPPGWMRGGW